MVLYIAFLVGVKLFVIDAVEKNGYNNIQNNASAQVTAAATTAPVTKAVTTKPVTTTKAATTKPVATTTTKKAVTTTPPATTKAKTTTTTAATTTTTAVTTTTKANKTKTTNNFKVVNICFTDSNPINGSANKKDEISRNSPVYVIYDLMKDDVNSGTEYIAGSYSWDIIYPNGEVENGYSGGDVIYDGYSYQSYFIQLTEDSGYGGKGTIKIIFYDNSGNTLASGSVKLV